MRIVAQRVTRAAVVVDGETVGSIGGGLLLLLGVERGDGDAQVATAVRKLAGIRIFEDDEGKMNLGPSEAGAAMLVVSQFTLAASLAKGRRPSFGRAAPPDEAEPLVEAVADGLRARGLEVETGSFGSHMTVELVNDGPVTLILDIGADGSVAHRSE